MFCGSIIPIILIIILVLLAVILTGLFEKSPQKTGGSKVSQTGLSKVSQTFSKGLKSPQKPKGLKTGGSHKMGFFKKTPQKTGGSHKRLYVNKFYKKSSLPEVDYDLPSLYEKMKINDPWSLWPQVFVDDWAF